MSTARFWTPVEDGRVQCDACPHGCRPVEGARGRCFVRLNREGRLVSAAWGRPAALAVDPVEKKPLYHVLPGTSVLSIGTLGCNLACRFCQNDSLSRPQGEGGAGPLVSPEELAALAVREQIPMVVATYNEPAVWPEYAMDLADAVHARGLRMAAVTSGYIQGEARREFFRRMDAANVDLKSFRDSFYRNLCGARLAPVLETLVYIRRETACWLEVTTLLIPGWNDSEAEVDELTAWVAEELGPDTPLHFSRFHGASDMSAGEDTPLSTLLRAKQQAVRNGLHYVYLGNVHGVDGGVDTLCKACGRMLIARNGFRVNRLGMDEEGKCLACGTICAGIWA